MTKCCGECHQHPCPGENAMASSASSQLRAWATGRSVLTIACIKELALAVTTRLSNAEGQIELLKAEIEQLKGE